MSDRDRVLRDLQARAKASGRRVFGYASEKAGCAELEPKKGVPETWDRVCVEGDTKWTPIPAANEDTEPKLSRRKGA